jgi:hypothetical protein
MRCLKIRQAELSFINAGGILLFCNETDLGAVIFQNGQIMWLLVAFFLKQQKTQNP